MVYVYLVGSYACSDQVAFDADMLFVVTVEPLLAFNIVYGPLIQTRHRAEVSCRTAWSYSKCCSI